MLTVSGATSGCVTTHAYITILLVSVNVTTQTVSLPPISVENSELTMIVAPAPYTTFEAATPPNGNGNTISSIGMRGTLFIFPKFKHSVGEWQNRPWIRHFLRRMFTDYGNSVNKFAPSKNRWHLKGRPIISLCLITVAVNRPS